MQLTGSGKRRIGRHDEHASSWNPCASPSNAQHGKRGALGYVNLQRLAGADDFLVGYATKIKHGEYPPLEYRVARVNAAGEVLSTKRLNGTGWGEDDVQARWEERKLQLIDAAASAAGPPQRPVVAKRREVGESRRRLFECGWRRCGGRWSRARRR